MFTKRLARRIAAAVLAATLAVGGATAVDAAQQPGNDTEEAGATWSFGGDDDNGNGKGGRGTRGATWS